MKKIRVKATGAIYTASEYANITVNECDSWGNPLEFGLDEVEIIDGGISHKEEEFDIRRFESEYLHLKEKSFPKDEDYWTRLEHQYAGMAMQGMLNNSLLITGLLKVNKSHEDIIAEVTGTAIRYAHALVEKYRKEQKK